MDFLVMLLAYCAIFIVGSLLMLYRDAPILKRGPLGAIRNFVVEAVWGLIPGRIQSIMAATSNYLLFQRNHVFHVVYIVITMLCHAVWLVDMLPMLYAKYPDTNHTILPFLALFVNYFCFHKAWTGSPAVIINRNHGDFMKIYKYDGIFYKKDTYCTTCEMVKPPRSKHCSTCNRCVHRFDHHCIWTNNCVGALTHRYFLLYMATLVTMWIQGVYVGMGCIMDYAVDIKLFTASYVDKKSGDVKPVTISVACQHLFMSKPRMVFLVIALSVLIILVGVFLGHHMYQVLRNETTNERYKRIAANSQHLIPAKFGKDYRPYSRGVLNNFMEVFFPHNFIQSRLKED